MMLFFFIVARYLFILSEPLSIVISLFGLLCSGIIIKVLDKKSAGKIRVEIAEKV